MKDVTALTRAAATWFQRYRKIKTQRVSTLYTDPRTGLIKPIPETIQTTEGGDPLSRRAGRQDVVELFITVSPQGRVTARSVYRPSGARPLNPRSGGLAIGRFRFHPARRDGTPVEDQAILPVVSSIADIFHEMGALISFGETLGVDSVRLYMIQNTGGHLSSDYARMNVAHENHPLPMAFLENTPRSASRPVDRTSLRCRELAPTLAGSDVAVRRPSCRLRTRRSPGGVAAGYGQADRNHCAMHRRPDPLRNRPRSAASGGARAPSARIRPASPVPDEGTPCPRRRRHPAALTARLAHPC